MKDKLIHGVVPAVLLTLAVGSIYAFSIFVQPIAAATGWSDPKTVQFAFSLGIFFHEKVELDLNRIDSGFLIDQEVTAI